MLTAEFTEAVDALIQDTSLSNKALKARALRYLSLLPKDKLSGPPWAQRIQKAIPKAAVFSTFHLFVALYAVADELKLVAGKRYVSATICACHDRAISAAPVGPEHENQSTTNLIQALDEVASTWVAFVLWPFYAHGADINLNPAPACRCRRVPTPRTESEHLAKLQQRRWKEQVMARDNYYSFMCGRYDIDWFLRQPNPPEGADNYDCDVIRIIKREVFAQDEDSMSVRGEAQDVDSLGIMRGILKRYFGADDALLAKAEGPQNMLFVNTSACIGFRTFTWCLHPTKTPNRYKIKSYGPPNYAGSRHVTSHVTFVDHSQSHSPNQSHSESPSPSSSQAPASASALAGQMPLAAGSTEADPEPVPLPDPALLRLHAALAGLLCMSGADRTFECLFARPPWLPGLERWPAPRGAAFWASVVEYEGEETCLEIDLHQSVEELWEDMLERAVAAGEYDRRPAATNSREGSPSRHWDGDACVSNTD